jgi:tol-pal system protein YbgF
MRTRRILFFSGAMFASAIAGSLVGPKPALAVAREIIELQRDVTAILQGQKDLQTQMTQEHTIQKTLTEQSADSVNKLNSTMASLQKSVQDVQANSGTRLDTMSTQLQGVSDNLEEIKSRVGKLNQQLVDLQSSVQSIDARLAGGGSAPLSSPGGAPSSVPPSSSTPSPSGSASASPAGPPPSADTLYSNGLRDITSGKYELASSEFQDYLKYYGDTDLASNAQFYLGEIAYAQKNYENAVQEYDKVLNNYPKSFKLAPARYKKGMALLELGQKNSGIKELREVVKRYPGTEEERRARAKLKDMGVAVTATTAH